MKRMLLAWSVVVFIALPCFADTWYSIDGFTLDTDDSITIDAGSADTQFVGFIFDGAADATVGGRLVSGGGMMSAEDIAFAETYGIVRALNGDSGSKVDSVQIDRRTTLAGVNGFYVSVYSTSGRHDAFVVDLGHTPGGTFTHMVLFTRESGDEGRRLLDRLLGSLTVSVEDAAG